jgi:hypothetical protein
MGNNSAATVASHMRYGFRAVRFRLVVGIGGGVPSEECCAQQTGMHEMVVEVLLIAIYST